MHIIDYLNDLGLEHTNQVPITEFLLWISVGLSKGDGPFKFNVFMKVNDLNEILDNLTLEELDDWRELDGHL